jgi:hypothetical protein
MPATKSSCCQQVKSDPWTESQGSSENMRAEELMMTFSVPRGCQGCQARSIKTVSLYVRSEISPSPQAQQQAVILEQKGRTICAIEGFVWYVVDRLYSLPVLSSHCESRHSSAVPLVVTAIHLLTYCRLEHTIRAETTRSKSMKTCSTEVLRSYTALRFYMASLSRPWHARIPPRHFRS